MVWPRKVRTNVLCLNLNPIYNYISHMATGGPFSPYVAWSRLAPVLGTGVQMCQHERHLFTYFIYYITQIYLWVIVDIANLQLHVMNKPGVEHSGVYDSTDEPNPQQICFSPSPTLAEPWPLVGLYTIAAMFWVINQLGITNIYSILQYFQGLLILIIGDYYGLLIFIVLLRISIMTWDEKIPQKYVFYEETIGEHTIL